MTLNEKKKIEKRMLEIEKISERKQKWQVHLGEIPHPGANIVVTHPAYVQEYMEIDERLNVAYEEEQKEKE